MQPFRMHGVERVLHELEPIAGHDRFADEPNRAVDDKRRQARKKRRGRRPALDPTDRRRLAARIAKMVLVDRLEQKEILQQLTKSEPGLAHIDASTVSRLYRFALDTGIVRVHIDENAPFKPARLDHLERELIAAY